MEPTPDQIQIAWCIFYYGIFCIFCFWISSMFGNPIFFSDNSDLQTSPTGKVYHLFVQNNFSLQEKVIGSFIMILIFVFLFVFLNIIFIFFTIFIPLCIVQAYTEPLSYFITLEFYKKFLIYGILGSCIVPWVVILILIPIAILWLSPFKCFSNVMKKIF